MLQYFHGIYENGVIRPLEPVELCENQPVWVSVTMVSPSEVATAAQQRAAMEELDRELEGLDENVPDDGFTAADHDQALYGGTA